MAPAEHAAVLFMDGTQVDRQMRHSEFGAFLDGYVGLSDLADQDVRAVYAVLTDTLRVRALVFFRLYFDEEGRADSHWNIPVETLAEQGATGPDMGGGPIRLVCRSQSPDPAVADELWDPDMTPGSNHFQSIRRALGENRLKFPPPREPEPEIPVLRHEAASARSASAGGDLQEMLQQRTRLARIIREQRLRIRTLQSVQRDALSDLQREHRHQTQSLRNQLQDLERKHERQRLSNEQLKTRLAERNEQYLSMQEKLERASNSRKLDSHASSAETVLLREQLERRQQEMQRQASRIAELEQELQQTKAIEPPDDSLMKHLQEQGLFLVAYHAGIGHITLPFAEINRYMGNPVAYAAEKCGVSESDYRQWLAHYENPVCIHERDGVACAQPLMRVSQPCDFRAGRDDRCDSHQAES